MLGTSLKYSLANITLELSWKGAFRSSETMFYEVTVGTETGAGNVLLGVETYDNFITINSHKFLFAKQIFVCVTAITPQGLYESMYDTLLL